MDLASIRFRGPLRALYACVFAALLVVILNKVLPLGTPPGIILYGAIVGSLTGLLAIGVVLVYQANRIINFAQAALGSVGLILAFELQFNWHWPFLIAVPVGILASAVIGGLSELAIIRRFGNAPRLIVTLGTIGLANILLFLQLIIVVLFELDSERTAAGTTRFPSPLGHKAFVLSDFVFSYNTVLAMVVVPALLAIIVVFFRRSIFGLGMRGAAENGDRAKLLGIPVGRLSTGFWMLAGVLAAVGTILRAPITGYSFSDLSSTGFLAIMLTAAVVGRFERLGVTFLAAVAIGIADQLYFYNFSSSAPLEAMHLAVVLVALILFRQGGRAGWGEVTSWKALREVRPVPRELARLVEVRVGRWMLPLLVIATAALVPLFVRDLAPLRLATIIGIWAIAGVSLVILTGWAGQISLGQWSLVGVGAIIAGRLLTLPQQPSLVLILVASGLSSAAVAALLGLPAMRLRGLYLAVATFGFAAAASSWIFPLDVMQPTGDILRPPFFRSEASVFYLVLGILTLFVIIARNVRASKFGRALIAGRDNEQAAEAFGLNLLRARMAAFVLSGAMAGVAGGLYTLVNQSMRYQDFDPPGSLLVFAIGVIGGLGSIPGTLIGAVYIVGAGSYLPSWGTFLATGGGILFFLLVFPGGLGQLAYSGRDWLLRLVAERRGLLSPSLLADLGEFDNQTELVPATEPARDLQLVTAEAARRE